MSEWVSFQEFAEKFPNTASVIMGRYRMSDTRFVQAMPLRNGFVCIAAPCLGGIDPPCKGMIIDLTNVSCVLSIQRYGDDGMSLVMDEIEKYTIGLRFNGGE